MINEFKKKLEKYETIIIHRHKRPDYDAIGSQMGLKYLLKNNYPQKQIYATGINGFAEFDYIGKIDYVSDDKFKNALCIVCDTANKDRIEDDRFKLSDFVVKIDHHQVVEDEQYGNLNLVYPQMSSTSEVITMLSEEMDLNLDSYSANYLYYGIYGDTGGFRFSSTTAKTYERVAKLRSYEWDFNETIMHLTTRSYHIKKLFAYSIMNLEIKNRVGFIKFTQDFIMENNYTNSDISMVVNNLGEIRDIDKWVVFNEYPTFVRINMRSRPGFDVSKIAVKYHGGGHKNASGASIKYMEDSQKIIDALIELKKDD